MDGYIYVAAVSALALLAYYFTLLRAGLARVKFKVEAPSHSGASVMRSDITALQKSDCAGSMPACRPFIFSFWDR